MTKKSLLSALVLTGLLASGCGSSKNSSKESSSSKHSSLVASISSTASSYTSSSSSSSSSSTVSSSSSSSSSEETNDPYTYFAEALAKDYSNMTCGVTQIYGQGAASEYQLEYYYNDYQIVYETYLAESGYDPYLYYHDYNGDNYLYFSPDSINPQGAWLNKGYKDADLSLENAYFSMNMLLSNLTAADVEYESGIYFIKENLLAKLNSSVFRFAYENNPVMCGIYLDAEGYLAKIVAVDPYEYDATDGVIIELADFGTTRFDNSKLPPEPNEDNVKEYWEYKGWDGPYVDVYPESVTLTLDSDVTGDETYDAIIDIEKSVEFAYSFMPENTNVRDINFHSTNEDVAVVSSSWTSGKRSILGVSSGECSIYATFTDANGVTKRSNELKVKVRPLQAQNKDNCVFDLTFDTIDDSGNVYTTNAIENSIPYSVTTHKAELRDGKLSQGVFASGDAVMVVNPADSKVMDAKDYVHFDFANQQVSSISLYYAMFYTSGFNGLSQIKKISVRYSNDGETYNEVDVTSEVKENISIDNLKLLEVSFAPSSIVELYFESNIIGVPFSFAFDGVAFMKDETCNDYNPNPVDVPVESVLLSTLSESLSLEVGKKMNFTATCLPTNATNKQVTFMVSNTDVAAISQSGELVALSAGSVEVYAVSSNNVESNRITVQVNPKTTLPASLVNTSWVGSDDNYNDCEIKVVSDSQIKVVFPSEEYTLDIDGKDGQFYRFIDDASELLIKPSSSYSDRLEISGYVATHYFNRYSSNIEFTKVIPLVSISLEMRKTDILVGESVSLVIKFNPNNASNKDYVVSGYDRSIVEVNEYNVVKGLQVGSTTITVSVGDISASISVNVVEKVFPTDITLEASKTTLNIGETTQIVTTFANEDCNQQELTYKSSDSSIASVNKQGLVTANKAGSATITVTTQNGISKTISFEVVNPNASMFDTLAGTYYSATEDVTLVIDSSGEVSLTGPYGEENYFSFDSVDGSEYCFYNEDDGSELYITVTEDGLVVTCYDYTNGIFISEATDFELI